MTGSVNKVILVGNLGQDPEVKMSNSGNKIVNFNIATSETWKDRQSGERQERTEWHRVVIFNQNLADIAERYFKKGSKVYVEGSLQTRKWSDSSGVERKTTEVVLSNFKGELTILDSKGQSSGQGASQESQAPAPASGANWDSYTSDTSSADPDDKIPF